MSTARLRPLPIALTIAGSDSGGGAGIQTDLKTFAAFGVHGTTAITCITAQNPRGVSAIQPVSVAMVQKQLEAVFTELRPNAVKTGMLFSTGIIKVVAEFFEQPNRPPLVVDPVMVATSGAKLLKPSAIRSLQARLLPLAALVTPNLDEAEILIEGKIRSLADLHQAAREIHARYGCPALVKGGHLKAGREAVDVLFDGKRVLVLAALRVRGVSTHGTGCTYSAAITAGLAQGLTLVEAVRRAKRHITQAIQASRSVGRHTVLGEI